MMTLKPYTHHLASLAAIAALGVVVMNHVNAKPESFSDKTDVSLNRPEPELPKKKIIKPEHLASLHLFGNAVDNKVAKDNTNTTLIETGSLPETKLALTVNGLFTHDDKTRGHAIIADKQGMEKSYKVGDTITGKATLHSVYSDHVIINNNQQLEILGLPEFRTGDHKQATANRNIRNFKKQVAARSKNNS